MDSFISLLLVLLSGSATIAVTYHIVHGHKKNHNQEPVAKEKPQTEEQKQEQNEENEAELFGTFIGPPEVENKCSTDEEQELCGTFITPQNDRVRLKPIQRGGRSRSSSSDPNRSRGRTKRHRSLKPEIICYKQECQWIIAVEVPEELSEKSDFRILQNGIVLSKDERKEFCWPLAQISGELEAFWNSNETEQKTKTQIGHDGYLLFKLIGSDLKNGRLVESVSSGAYLVIVPDTWERDVTLSGFPPVTPEPVIFEGYTAHFFYIQKSGESKIAFTTPDLGPKVIASKVPIFELIGNHIEDASDNIGPLFIQYPPLIKTLDTSAWENVKTIIVGEEGTGRKKWRKEYIPNPGQSTQNLLTNLIERKSGWYFLRFYDSNDDLIDSYDFRFISDLKEIILPDPQPLPSKDGYREVNVQFIHEAGCTIRLKESINIEHLSEKTIATVPPDPSCDRLRFLVRSKNGHPVEIAILIERIWWSVADEYSQPSEWHDHPIMLSNKDFKATSNKALWLRLPKCRWIDKVLVGFERANARPYGVKVTENTIAIPLRDYCDYKELDDRSQSHCLRIYINRRNQEIEGILANLQLSQRPAEHKSAVKSTSRTPNQFWMGLGRKKNAYAKAVLRPGKNEIIVNDLLLDDYFRRTASSGRRFLERLLTMHEVHEILSGFDVHITIKGSDPRASRQVKAAAHAISRALISYNPRLRVVLRNAGFGGIKVKEANMIGERKDESN